MIGKDAIVIKDGKQVTEFKEGVLPWSVQNPVALVFDEYDAGRPDVMFVIQRILESEGKLTLLDKNKVIDQNKFLECLQLQTQLDWVIQLVFTTEHNKSIKVKWIDGTLLRH